MQNQPQDTFPKPQKPPKNFRKRRIFAVLTILLAVATWLALNPNSFEQTYSEPESSNTSALESPQTNAENSREDSSPLATDILARLEIKGRAPKTGYSRDEFYSSWPIIDGCSLRQRIIKREMGDSAHLDDDNCTVISGEFDEPYTGEHKTFTQKADFSKGIQIDHVVALSDAWQKGAQNLSKDERHQLATDPLNLLAVDASTNQGKSDGDSASWLPSNKKFRCAYVARQVSVKYKYHLWVTDAEKDAILQVLQNCPNELAIGVSL